VTKIIKAKYKKSRRLGVSLWGTAKDPFNSRNFPPGQHGTAGYKKLSNYGTQLQAKQRLKKYYGYVTEKQFRKIFTEAARIKGDTGENLIGLLERRLDSVVYRLNFARTIFSARQLVSHKHVKVNGQSVNIPSYIVKPGDIIEVTDSAKENVNVMDAIQKMERSIPDYLECVASEFKGTFVRTPKLADVPYPVVMEPQLVVEFYSR
jgi:small subunit ribosomal protein S4